ELEKENPGAEIIEEFESFLKAIKNYKKLLQMKNLKHFIQFNDELEEVIIGQQNVKASNVYTDYIQNSVINTSGNVILKNKGCYNSKIIAAGDIVAPGKQGALRGGIYRANNIYAREISSGLSITYIHIKESFYVSRIVGDVVIKAPEDSLNVSDRETGINIFVDKEGNIKNRTSRPPLKKLNV
ncbi:MAG TPA: hypothetical protein VKY40_04975, partial [Halanaerobiales bacterium]|nr:hypothetical protein [Halanaerobiales bacterium]